MRVSREQAAENRERIVETAARLFRERGFDGIGVADLMKDAGLTHGGFYGHFKSKEDLMTEAAVRAMTRGAADWDQMIARSSEPPLTAVLRGYLSKTHCDSPGHGCVMAMLGSDVARQGPALRQAVSKGVMILVEKLAGLIPGRSRAIRRQRAMATYAGMIGALLLARVLDDPALSEEVMQAVIDTAPGQG